MASVAFCPKFIKLLVPTYQHCSFSSHYSILKKNNLLSPHLQLKFSSTDSEPVSINKIHFRCSVAKDFNSEDSKTPLSINRGVIPLLKFGTDGNMVFKSRPDFEDKYTAEDSKTGVSSSKNVKKYENTAKNSTPKWKGGIPEAPKKPRALTSAPKYSKAARRFYNDTFRKTERLGKVLARAGVASRRASEDVVFSGRVSVNGVICKTPQTAVDLVKDEILVDGKAISKKEPRKFYFAVNKPKGYICSTVSETQKPALTLLDDYFHVWKKRNPGLPKPRLFTVGRLDVATSGLLLITNDGDFAQKVSHPSSGLTKEYVAAVDKKITKRQLATVSEGTVVDGVKCVPDFAEIMENNATQESYKLRITVSEGRNHEVRNIIENAGLNVKALKRVRIGGFRIPKTLALGKFEVLTPPQMEQLFSSKF